MNDCGIWSRTKMAWRRGFYTLAALTLVAADGRASRNPLFAGADPDIIAACGEWWIFPTSQGAMPRREFTSRFYAWHSPDLQHWRKTEPVLTIGSIKWIGDDGQPEHYLWAPSVTRANGRYYMYYSVGPQGASPSRIGVAVATRPDGPYVDSGKPLLTGGNGFEAIDPVVFPDRRTGLAYLYAGGSAGAKLRVFEVAPDLVSLGREIPVATPAQFTEGAFMHERKGIYYLSYSHGRFNGPDYSVHYATGTSPIGPWTYRGAVLTSDATHKGPGHHAFVTNPALGRSVVAYHRWNRSDATPPFTGMRDVAVEELRYGRDGSILPIKMTNGAPPRLPAPAERCDVAATP